MNDRMVLKLLSLILVLGAAPALAQDSMYGTPDTDGSTALAEQLTTFAHQTFHQGKIPSKALQLDAALYRAAMRLNPNEPRYARALADIMLEMNDIPGAADALRTYMSLNPSDQTAQIQYIDVELASDQMQSLDQRLGYLRFLLKKQQIPDAVKSEIAFRAAQLLMDRGQKEEALKLLDAARILNPLNIRAMRVRYVMTQESATNIDRVQQLANILHANPSDPVVASRLAEQLALLGLIGPAINWYGVADQLYNITGTRADPAFVLGASSELLLGKHAEDAARLAGKYTADIPEDADGWFLALSILRFQLSLYDDPQQEAFQKTTIQRASIAITNRIMVLREMTGDTQATTRPVDSPTDTALPNLDDDAGRFDAAQYRSLAPMYESSLESLAWLNLFYRHDVDTAGTLIDDLPRVGLPKTDPVYLRLCAWKEYLAGNKKGALPKLEALAKVDPLAGMGAVLIKLEDSAGPTKALVEAQKLLNEHPCGVMGAVLWAEFAKYHLSIEPGPDAAGVAQVAANISNADMELVSAPRQAYTVDITPLKATYSFGDPILVRVTLQNISTLQIAIGDDCAIKPELWLNARLRGMLSQEVPGIAVGRLDQRLVLMPGESVSTIVRVDQDALHRLFTQNPKVDLTVNLMLITNPTFTAAADNKSATMRPGVCGFAQASSSLISRDPTPIDAPQQRLALYQGLNSEVGGEKIRSMIVMGAYIEGLAGQQGKEVQAVVNELIGKIHRVDNAGKDCVLAYQKYILAKVSTGDDKTSAVKAMAADEHWQTRLMALQLASQDGDQDLSVVEQLTGNKDPIVRDYAIALSQSMQAAKASAPPASPAAPTSDAPNPEPAPQTSETPSP